MKEQQKVKSDKATPGIVPLGAAAGLSVPQNLSNKILIFGRRLSRIVGELNRIVANSIFQRCGQRFFSKTHAINKRPEH